MQQETAPPQATTLVVKICDPSQPDACSRRRYSLSGSVWKDAYDHADLTVAALFERAAEQFRRAPGSFILQFRDEDGDLCPIALEKELADLRVPARPHTALVQLEWIAAYDGQRSYARQRR